MPGIFGGVGCAPDTYAALRREFAAAYGAGHSLNTGGGMLGGHAFGTRSALHGSPDSGYFAVDGEPSIYLLAEHRARGNGSSLYELSSGEMVLTSACKGNVAAVDPESGAWHVATEWTGSFPLYYAVTDGGFLFCSRVLPLARILGPPPDPVGMMEFLLRGYRIAARTDFLDVRRLLPGQILSYEPRSRRLRLREASRLWSDAGKNADTLQEAATSAWESLGNALRRSVNGNGRHALMMSGGWDSRTLFAAELAHVGAERLVAYAHGDFESRELRLVERICQQAGVDLRREPLDDTMYYLERLGRGFARVEHVMFPHWHRAGALLADAGMRSVSGGVYGEVLGGHYGPAMVLPGRRKIAAVASRLLRRSLDPDRSRTARDLLLFKRSQKPWFIAQDAWDRIPHLKEAMNVDVEASLERLENRGIGGNDELVEAFITEHRGTQYINAQILSARAHLDVVLPYTDRDVLTVSTGVRLKDKIHNGINRAMLQRYAPELLRLPCSAVLLPARAPLLAQEMSRLVRKRFEDGRWKLYFATRGSVGPPRFGWGNFEFLRNGRALNAVADDLRSELWNRDAIKKRIEGLIQLARGSAVVPLTFLLMRMYSVELMLRSAYRVHDVTDAPAAGITTATEGERHDSYADTSF